MARYLVLNYKDYGLFQDIKQTIQSYVLACVCCLQKDVPLINLVTCKHTRFLELLEMPEIEPSRKVICYKCHHFLKKIDAFKVRAFESFFTLMTENYTTCEKPKQHELVMQKAVDIHFRPDDLDYEFIVPNKHGTDDHDMELTTPEAEDILHQIKYISPEVIPVIHQPSNSVLVEPVVISPISNEPNNQHLENNMAESTLEMLLEGTDIFSNSKKNLTKAEKKTNLLTEKVHRKAVTRRQQKLQPCKENKAVSVVKITKEDVILERKEIYESEAYKSCPHKCDTCLLGFQFKDNLEDHRKRKHTVTNAGSHTCEICLSVLHPPSIVNAHYARHYTRYQCEKCKKLFLTMDGCTIHYNKAHKI